jgi:signal peptidase I
MKCHFILQILLQALNFITVLSTGLMIYKGIGLVTNTESPIVVVLRYGISSY